MLGETDLSFVLNGVKTRATFVVTDDVDEVITGMNILTRPDLECVWDFKSGVFTVRGCPVKLQSRRTSHIRRIYVAENVKVENNSFTDVPVRLTCDGLRTRKANWLLSPKAVNNVLIPRTLLNDNVEAVIRVVNVTESDTVLKTGDLIGVAEPVDFGSEKCGNVCSCDVPVEGDNSGIVKVDSQSNVSLADSRNSAVDMPTCSGCQFVGKPVSHDELIEPMLASLPDCITVAQRA